MDMLSLIAIVNFFSPKKPTPEVVYSDCLSALSQELKTNKVSMTLECRNSFLKKAGSAKVFVSKDIVFIMKDKFIGIISGNSTEIKDIERFILVNEDTILIKNKLENRIIFFSLNDSGNIRPTRVIKLDYSFSDFMQSKDKRTLIITKNDGSQAKEDLNKLIKKD